MTAAAKQDAWLSCVISVFICLGYVYFLYKCATGMGKKNYIEYLESVYGKVLGKIIGLLYVLFAFIGTCSLLAYFGYFTTTQILTDTPIEVLNMLFALLIIIVVRAGIEVIARTGELLSAWFFILLIGLIIFLLPEIELERLSPLYEASFSDHAKAIYNFVSIAGFPMILFLMFFPKNINRPDKSKWNFLSGTFIGTTTVTFVTVLCILVLGASTTARQLYPSYVLAKTISLFEIIERLESVMAGIWVISIFFKSALYFYACVIAFAQILGVKKYQFLVFPLGIISIIFSVIVYPDIEYMQNWDAKYWPTYALVMGLIIPVATFILDKIKQGIKKKSSGTA